MITTLIHHSIIMSSSYSRGCRIAFDTIVATKQDSQLYHQRILEIQKRCGKDTSISAHFLSTPSKDWGSVVAADPYFEDVLLIDNFETFVQLIQQDRTLRGLDVAQYILCKLSCTPLKLHQLTCLCFADYLRQTGKKLFRDPIYTSDDGLIVESIRAKCAYDDTTILSRKEELEMPMRSRILFAEDGRKKLSSINTTIEQYAISNRSEREGFYYVYCT